MGIPTDIFISQPDANLICAICFDVFEEAVSLQSCGHTFCRSCIDQVAGSTCPTCRHDSFTGSNDTSRFSVFGGGGGRSPNRHQHAPNHVARSMIAELQIKCKYNHKEEQHVRCLNVARGGSSRSNNNSPTNQDGEESGLELVRGADTSQRQPNRKRLRLATTNDDEADEDDCCSWVGKVGDWKDHADKTCRLHIVTCPIVGCNHQCKRKDVARHQLENVTEHVNLMVDAKMTTLEARIQHRLQQQEQQQQEMEHSLKKVKREHRLDLIHYHLTTNICRSWCAHRPQALRDFVLCRPRILYYPYNVEPSGRVHRLLCGIPGPTNTPWEGGIFPLLLTWQDVHRPPMCQFPQNFYHANVLQNGAIVTTMYRERQWHAEITVPEILFNIQQMLAHPRYYSNAISSTGTATNNHVRNNLTTPTSSSPTFGGSSSNNNINNNNRVSPTFNSFGLPVSTPPTVVSSNATEAYHTFVNNREEYDRKIRETVREKYSYNSTSQAGTDEATSSSPSTSSLTLSSVAEHFLTKTNLSVEERKLVGNMSNWCLVDGARTTWKLDWQQLEEQEEEAAHQQAPTSYATAGSTASKSPRPTPDPSTMCSTTPTGGTATTTSSNSLPCGCSCCVNGASFWDSRHEMRFFFGSGI